MSFLALLAIIFDRDSSPSRSIVIATTFILLFTHETILSASLQMPLAACLALTITFEKLEHIIIPKAATRVRRFANYILRVAISTLVAGVETTPYVVYHFHQYSTYSIITNMLTVPLADFVIMPLERLSLLLMPLGMDYPLCFLLEKSINIIVA